MIEGKRNLIAQLINEYDIQEVLKDLLEETIQEMLQAEMTEHLGYEEY